MGQLLIHHNARDVFMCVYQNGTAEAQAYALTALYVISPKDYKTVATHFRRANPLVQTGRGCMLTAYRAREVLSMLESDYTTIYVRDRYLNADKPDNSSAHDPKAR
jgi:hypothetical protein